MRLHFLAAGILFAGAASAQPKAPACDRACLESFVDRYLDAVLAHAPSKVPIAKGAKFTENGERLELGDGLWNTMDGKGSYRVFVTDVEAQQVAFLGSISEGKAPAMIALRLKIANQRIAEIESFIQRSPSSAQGFERIGYKWTEEVPPAERMSREDLLKVANMYFTGMQRNDGKGVYPFADDCNRIENGSNSTNVPVAQGKQRPDPKTASTYSANWSCREQFESGLIHFVSRIRDRRFVAVDPERGLVFSFTFFDHSAGDTRTYKTPDGRTVTGGPDQLWTWQIAELFQLRKSAQAASRGARQHSGPAGPAAASEPVERELPEGQIHQIEAIMERVPYGMPSGWSNWEEGLSDRGRDATK